jgi:hypothetical protein
MDEQIRTWSGLKGKKQTIFPAAGTQRGFCFRSRLLASKPESTEPGFAEDDNAEFIPTIRS